jgi:hypothetical protein
VSDAFSPYTALGAVRMIQFRVKNDCEDDPDSILPVNFDLSKPCTDLECFKVR